MVSAFNRLILGWVASIVAGAIFFGILVGRGVVAHSRQAVILTAILLSNTAGTIDFVP